MKKISSYQKLKQKIIESEAEKKEAINDLHNILMRPNTEDGIFAQAKWKMTFKVNESINRAIWTGEGTEDTEPKGLIQYNKCNGIL